MVAFDDRDVARLRADLSDTAEKWKLADLEDLLARAQEVYPRGTRTQLVDIAAAYGLMQLLGSAALFNDYVVAEEQQKKSDIWRQMNGTYQNKLAMRHVQAALNIDGGQGSQIESVPIGYQRTRGRGDEFARPGS